MVLIPAGEFVAGSNRSGNRWEGPEHTVYLDAYYIDRRKVTVREYLNCVSARRCSPLDKSAMVNLEAPVRGVSWKDASNYCAWVAKRLPTEAEWERAARGPKNHVNPWGDTPADVDMHGYPIIRPSMDVSGFGVYGLVDGTGEWVADWYSADYYQRSPKNNPIGPEAGELNPITKGAPQRVVRGFGYKESRRSYFSVARIGQEQDVVSPFVGFRCAREALNK